MKAMTMTSIMTMATTKQAEQLHKEVQKWLRNEGEEGQQDRFWRLFEAECAAENALTALMNGITQQMKKGQFPPEGTHLFFHWLESVQHCLEAIAALHRVSLNRLTRLLPRLLVRSKDGRYAKLPPVVDERYSKAVAAADSFSEGVLLLCLQAAQYVELEALEKWKAGMQYVLEEIFRILRQKGELLHMLLSPEESQRGVSSQKVRVHMEPLQPSFGKPWLHESVWGGWKQKSQTDRNAGKWDE